MRHVFIILALVLSHAGYLHCAKEITNDRHVVMVPVTKAPEGEMRIGYFHGGRIHILYRIWLDKGYKAEGVKVGLYSKFLYDWQGLNRKGFFRVPEKAADMEAVNKGSDNFARVTGGRIIEAME
ncbi:MAG: hypothetical protein ABIG11_09170, partial [bacterium]